MSAEDSNTEDWLTAEDSKYSKLYFPASFLPISSLTNLRPTKSILLATKAWAYGWWFGVAHSDPKAISNQWGTDSKEDCKVTSNAIKSKVGESHWKINKVTNLSSFNKLSQKLKKNTLV